MDLQGQPIPSGKKGTKVTTDPASDRQRVNEPSGPVVKDSLAAESVSHGGAYSENRGSQPLGVSSGQSTTQNINTSGAAKLSSTSDATARGNAQKQERYPEALGGQGEFPGAHIPETGYVGGSKAARKEMGLNRHEYPASEKLSQSQSQSGGAPASGSGYQTRSATARAAQKPTAAAAGQGDVKDDFPSDPKYNASFTSDIGTQDDPGRLAESKFQRRQAETSDASGAPREKGAGDQHWYTPLQNDQRA